MEGNQKNQNQITEKKYDLEERTYLFAKNCRNFMKKLSRTVSHVEYGKQLIRSSGSVAANYIEANEALSKKDFFHRVKICRKEAKESTLWLRLLDSDSPELSKELDVLVQESVELTKIFGSMVSKFQS